MTVVNLRGDLNEAARLAELKSFEFLEHEANSLFDDVTQTLVAIFKTDIAFVCFVGRDQQKFLSQIGLGVNAAPRGDSFCSHAISQDQPFCISNAAVDERFSSNPAVTGGPKLRFYAGAPLITSNGFKIGTLSIADRAPRELTADERGTLAAMARLVVHQLEGQKARYEKDHETARLQTLLDDVANVISEGLAVFDQDDRLVYCNRKYREYYGKGAGYVRLKRTFEEILKDGVNAGYFADAIGREEDWLRQRLAHHANPPDEPLEQRHINGQWLLISERRLPGGGIVGVRTDITRLKENERSIRESEQKFKDYTATASDWIWETGIDGKVTHLSGNQLGMKGLDSDKILGKSRHEVTSENRQEEKWSWLDATIANREPFSEFTYRMMGTDGTEQVICVSGVPAYDETGEFRGYRGTGRNITAQVRTTERLQAAEARIRAALNNTLVGIILIDAKGTVLEFNREAERMFQYDSSDVIGRNAAMLMPEDHAIRHDAFLARYWETGEKRFLGQARRVLGRRKDGTHFPLTLGLGEVDLPDGIQFIGSLTDLSEQEKLENQLQRAQKLEAIGQLTGGIAHDFNNILGIIVGNLELGLRRAEPGSKLAGYFEKAHSAAARATRTTQQLLSFSRQKDYYSESLTCELNTAVKDVEALLQGSMTKGVELTIRPLPSPLKAHVDVGDLQDALINLAVNARDAMNNRGTLTISLDEIHLQKNSYAPGLADLPCGRYGVISVADSGPGIPEEVKSRIFEPFFTTKPKGQGTGLGLAMVYGFVKRSRGDINVYSETGVGTCFRLYIPLLEDMPEVAPAAEKLSAGIPRGQEQVLVVDDEPELADYAKTSLEELGYEVRTCTSPAEALQVLMVDRGISLLFTDIVMPGPLNGVELVDQARDMRPGLKCLYTSGFPGEVLEKANLKATDFLAKPYNRAGLARAVRRCLDEGKTP